MKESPPSKSPFLTGHQGKKGEERDVVRPSSDFPRGKSAKKVCSFQDMAKRDEAVLFSRMETQTSGPPFLRHFLSETSGMFDVAVRKCFPAKRETARCNFCSFIDNIAKRGKTSALVMVMLIPSSLHSFTFPTILRRIHTLLKRTRNSRSGIFALTRSNSI